jgi:hypothetical protein
MLRIDRLSTHNKNKSSCTIFNASQSEVYHLREKIEQYHIEPRHIYNMDEKGFMLGVVGQLKRIFSRTSYEDEKRRSTIQDGSREWITLLGPAVVSVTIRR